MEIDHPNDESFEAFPDQGAPERNTLRLNEQLGSVSMVPPRIDSARSGSRLYQRPLGGILPEDDIPLTGAPPVEGESAAPPPPPASPSETENVSDIGGQEQHDTTEHQAWEPPIAPGMVRIVKIPEKSDAKGNPDKDDVVAPDLGNVRTAALTGQTQRIILGRTPEGRVFQDVTPSLVSGKMQVREANNSADPGESPGAGLPEVYPYSVRFTVEANEQAGDAQNAGRRSSDADNNPLGDPARFDSDKILEATGTTGFAVDFAHGGVPPQQLGNKLLWTQQRAAELKGDFSLAALKEMRELAGWLSTLTSADDVGIGRQALTAHAASPEDLQRVVRAVEGTSAVDAEMFKAERNPDGTLQYRHAGEYPQSQPSSGNSVPTTPNLLAGMFSETAGMAATTRDRAHEVMQNISEALGEGKIDVQQAAALIAEVRDMLVATDTVEAVAQGTAQALQEPAANQKPWTPDPTLKTADRFREAIRFVSARQPGIDTEREYDLDIASNHDIRNTWPRNTIITVGQDMYKGMPVGEVEFAVEGGHFLMAGGTMRGKSTAMDQIGTSIIGARHQEQVLAHFEGGPIPPDIKVITMNPLVEGEHERSAAYLAKLRRDAGLPPEKAAVTVAHPDFLALPMGDPRYATSELEATLFADAMTSGVLNLSTDPEVSRVLITYGLPGAREALMQAGGFPTTLEHLKQGIVDAINASDYEAKVKGNLVQFVGQYVERVAQSPFFKADRPMLDPLAMLEDPSWTRADLAAIKDPIVKTTAYMAFFGKIIQAQEYRLAQGTAGPVYILGDEFKEMFLKDSYVGRKLAALLPDLRHRKIFLGVGAQTGWSGVSEHLTGNVMAGVWIFNAQDGADRKVLSDIVGNTTEQEIGFTVTLPPGQGGFWRQGMDRISAIKGFDDQGMRAEGGVIIPSDQAPFADWGYVPEHLRGRIEPKKFDNAAETLYKKGLGARTINFDEVNAAAILTGNGAVDLHPERLLVPLQSMDPVERGIMIARDVADTWHSRHELIKWVAKFQLREQGVPFTDEDLIGHTRALMDKVIRTNIEDVLAQIEGGGRPPREVWAQFALPVGRFTPLLNDLEKVLTAPPLDGQDGQLFTALVGDRENVTSALEQQRTLERERDIWVRTVSKVVMAASKGGAPVVLAGEVVPYEKAMIEAVGALVRFTGGARDEGLADMRERIWQSQPVKTPETQQLYNQAFDTVVAELTKVYPDDELGSVFGYRPMMEKLQERIKMWRSAAPIDLSKYAATHGRLNEKGEYEDAFPPEAYTYAQEQRLAVAAAEDQYLRSLGPDMEELLEVEMDIYHAPDRRHGVLRLANAVSRLVEARQSKGYGVRAIRKEMLKGRESEDFSLPKLHGRDDSALLDTFAETFSDQFHFDISMDPSTKRALEERYDRFRGAMNQEAAALREKRAREAKADRELQGMNAEKGA